MHKYYTFVISFALFCTSVWGSIQLHKHDEDKPLTSTTLELLSLFKPCIVFIFDWGYENHSDPLTSTNYFIFYSKSISCSIVRETCMENRNKTLENRRFQTFQPHPLFTRHTSTLINLYSSVATSNYFYGKPATATIPAVIDVYNIPFNYVLLFLSKERFSSVDMNTMFSKCSRASAPAVYIMILDEDEVNVVGFAHVLQSAPYLFKVKTLEESHFQHLHETVHKDLQHSELQIISIYSPQACKLGWKIGLTPGDCTLGTLIENYNMTFCNVFYSACSPTRLTVLKSHQRLRSYKAGTRRSSIYYEFINYCYYYVEYSFTCIVETGPKSFVAFVEAFDLSTWIVTVVACMGMSVTVAAMSSKNASSLWTKLPPSTAVVVMFLFDRFYSHKKLELAASKKTVLVLTLWAFGALLLGMSYSGKMISELAAPSLPPLPQDMHELSLVKYPILTTDYKILNENGKKWDVGEIHDQISQYLEDNPGQNTTMINDLQRLKSAVTWIETSWIKHRPNISRPKRSRVIFAYADKLFRVKAAAKWSEMASSSLRSSPPRNLPFFGNQHHMILESNSLLPIFRKFLAKICEPGIISHWRHIGNADTSRRFISDHFQIFSLFSQMSTTMLGEGMTRRMNLAAIWRNFDSLLESTGSWSQITLHTLNAAFQLVGVGLLISTLVLFHERWPLHVVCHNLFQKVVNSIFDAKNGDHDSRKTHMAILAAGEAAVKPICEH